MSANIKLDAQTEVSASVLAGYLLNASFVSLDPMTVIQLAGLLENLETVQLTATSAAAVTRLKTVLQSSGVYFA